MTSTNKKISVAERLRFSTNKTLDSHTYIRLYTQALDVHMEVDQRQSFFMIAKFLTDGTMALHKRYSRLADYYFELSDRYINATPSSSKKYLNFIKNIYGRSKSFHYFKNGDIESTINLIEECLDATVELEKNEGLQFLVLDRISQYDNFSRVLFSQGKLGEGYKILSDCLVFLMTGKQNKERQFTDKYLEKKIPEYYEMKSVLMNNIIKDTLGSLQKEPEKEIFIESSLPLLTPIFQNLNDMVCHTPTDTKIKEWLNIIQLFYSNEILNFKKLAIQFRKKYSSDQKDPLVKLTTSFFRYC